MMGLTTPFNKDMQFLADKHREWLSLFDSRHLANWDKLFGNNNEAAMAEAAVRHRLEQYYVRVQPNEDLETSKKAPDFLCERSGIEFFVEVTCIETETAENVTGLPSDIPYEGDFSPLNLAVFNKCKEKVSQVSTVDAPALVAIGTWHSNAALLFNNKSIVNMLLTGETKMNWDINSKTSEESEVYQTTDLYPAIFFQPDSDKSPTAARESISGVLLFAFGMPGIEPLVVLNPNAKRPFNSVALHELEYGSVLVNRKERRLSVNWSRGCVSDV